MKEERIRKILMENTKEGGKMEEKIKIRAVPCEVYSRVVGYFRPVANWNAGKQIEFAERKMIRLDSRIKLCCLDRNVV